MDTEMELIIRINNLLANEGIRKSGNDIVSLSEYKFMILGNLLNSSGIDFVKRAVTSWEGFVAEAEEV